ncbi:MAG: DUF503 domain-containing protein [Planctomycetota bacterium]
MLHIGVLQFSLEIPWATSLKDKRRVLRSLKDRTRQYNVSVAEIDDHDQWTLATLGAVIAGTDVPYINGALDKYLEVLRALPDAQLVDHQLEIL